MITQGRQDAEPQVFRLNAVTICDLELVFVEIGRFPQNVGRFSDDSLRLCVPGVFALKFSCLNRKRPTRAGAVPDACPP
jgi:hypothetical protein